MKKIIKRDGRSVSFEKEKIAKAISSANKSLEKDKRITEEHLQEVVDWVIEKLPQGEDVEVEKVQDFIEEGLVNKNYTELFRTFRDYRKERERVRFLKNSTVQMMEAKYSGKNWDMQNANIDGLSFDGKAGEAYSVYDKEYALNYMITPKFAKNHRDYIVYIHDLDNYKKGKPNCLSFPADDFRDNGMTVKIPKDIRRAGSVSTESQLIMMELQSQSMPQFGGVSVTHWDTTLAPLVKKDFYKFYKKNYERLTEKELDSSFHPGLSIEEKNYVAHNKKAAKYALEDLKSEVHQAMEGLLHNANTLQSRSGNQLPFTSINYGADTSPEGRLISEELLDCWSEGIGEFGLTPIFPCGIFQYKKGINDKKGTPNYSLKKKAIEVLIRRDYPNFLNCDWSVDRKGFEKSQNIKKSVLEKLDAETFKKVTQLPKNIQQTLGFEIKSDGKGSWFEMNDYPQPFELASTMGCRTYNGFNANFTEDYFLNKVLLSTIENGKLPLNQFWSGNQKDGRGNIAPATIVLPMVAMKAVKSKSGDVVETFMKLLEDYIKDCKDELIERFNWIAAQGPEVSTFVYGNNTMKGYTPEDGIISALRHGTLAIGQLGLAECLEILIGCDHTEEKGMELAKRIEKLFADKCAEYKAEEHDKNGYKYFLNFGVYFTPAESLCYNAFKAFKKKYGEVENVTYFIEDGEKVQKEFFTNSIHVPVYKKISPFDKIDIESQLTGYSSAGCIVYVEIGDETKHNLKSIEQLIDYAMSKDVPYFALNFQINECTECGNTDNLTEEIGICPICGSKKINWLRRITGYLSGNFRSAFNLGKQRETELRALHSKYIYKKVVFFLR